MRPCYRVLLWITLFPLIIASCRRALGNPISLAAFTEDSVHVSVSLERDPSGNNVLAATFTPPHGFHLYSKDIPVTGINGLGRPTLLELTPQSHMQAIGGLTESVVTQATSDGPTDLLVYPAGPVTLSLPIKLPACKAWIKDEVRVSFVACSANQCKPPVETIIAIRLPCADLFNKPSSKGD